MVKCQISAYRQFLDHHRQAFCGIIVDVNRLTCWSDWFASLFIPQVRLFCTILAETKVLATALNTLMVDGHPHENELIAYKQLANRLRQLHPDFMPEDMDSQWNEQADWFSRIVEVEDVETKKVIYATAETMAILDGKVDRSEIKLIKEMAKLLDLKYDEKRLKTRAKPFYVPSPGRGCRIAALIILFVLLLTSCACSISGILLAQQFLQG